MNSPEIGKAIKRIEPIDAGIAWVKEPSPVVSEALRAVIVGGEIEVD